MACFDDLLAYINRDILNEIAQTLDIEVTSRREKKVIISGYLQAPKDKQRKAAELLLDSLMKYDLEYFCDNYGVSKRGKKSELVDALLEVIENEIGFDGATDLIANIDRSTATFQTILGYISLYSLAAIADRYGIYIPDRRKKSSFVSGILNEPSLPVKDTLESIYKDELKMLCEASNLSVNGKKSDLVARIVGAFFKSYKDLPSVCEANEDLNHEVVVHVGSGDDPIGSGAIKPRQFLRVSVPLDSNHSHRDGTRTFGVIDGDTIVVDSQQSLVLGHYNTSLHPAKYRFVRLLGMDAPETSHGDKAEKDLDRIDLFDEGERRIIFNKLAKLGEKSKDRLYGLLKGNILDLYIEFTGNKVSPLRSHKVHRIIAYVHVGEVDIGLRMIEDGYALVWPRQGYGAMFNKTYNHSRRAKYIAACNKSRAENRGLWKEGLSMLCGHDESKVLDLADESKVLDLATCMENCGNKR